MFVSWRRGDLFTGSTGLSESKLFKEGSFVSHYSYMPQLYKKLVCFMINCYRIANKTLAFLGTALSIIGFHIILVQFTIK